MTINLPLVKYMFYIFQAAILNDFSNAYSRYFTIKKDVMMKLFKFDLQN